MHNGNYNIIMSREDIKLIKVYVYTERMHKEVYEKLGKNIKKRRKELGITQEKLAEKINKDLGFVGKIEIAFSRPSFNTIIDISEALDISLKDLFDFD